MNRSTSLLSIIVLLTLTIGSAAVQSVTAQTKSTKKKVTYYSVKAGKIFRVRMNETISSKSAKVGDTFTTTMVDPVYSSRGVLLIPAGSIISGRVNGVHPAGKDGDPGTIDVSFKSITLPNKRRAGIAGYLTDLETDREKADNEGTVSANKTSRRNVKFIGGGAAGGAIIGGIAGGGSGAAIGAGAGAVGGLIAKRLLKGKDAEVKEGVEFGVYNSRTFSLPRY